MDDAGKPNFTDPATSKQPKLYVVTAEGKKAPIYVGITQQSMRTRLRFGWNAEGKGGYYGYRWRHDHEEVAIDVWCDSATYDKKVQDPMLNVETVEAEVVFLIRQMGQWPTHQTEIHFRPSKPHHRKIAEKIVSHYMGTRRSAVGA